MTLTSGSYGFGPERGRVLVRTSRTGLGRRAGHDLTIEATRWEAQAAVDPADPGQSSVTAAIEVGALEVREGTGGIKPLTDGDRADIKATITGKILRTAEHPMITFASTQVTGNPEAFQLTGNLTIMGQAHPVTISGSVAGGRIRGHATVAQTRWGIKPYSAFAGALRLADDVEVEFDLAAPGAETR